MKQGLFQFHVPGTIWATPTPEEQGSALGQSAESRGPVLWSVGCQGGRGHLGRARPTGSHPQTSASAPPGPEGSRSEGGGGWGAPSAPHLREDASGLSSSEPGLRGEGVDSPILPARRPPRRFHAAVAASPPPGTGAWGPRAAPTRAPALLLALLLPPPVPGLERAPRSPPRLRACSPRGRRLRAGRGSGRGAARLPGPGARGAPSRRRRAGTHSAARRARTRRLRSARGRAEDAGGLPRPRPALPPGRAPGAPLAAPPPPRPQPGREGGVPRAAHAGPGPASRSPRGGRPEFSSRRRLLLPPAAGRLWMLKGSPAPLPAGSRA